MASSFTALHSLILIPLTAWFCIINCTGLQLTPPLGNSLAITATTLDGKQTYRCHEGQWLPLSTTATLVDSKNHSKIIGSYLRIISSKSIDSNSNYGGTWNLLNNDGDQAESGHPASLVSAGKRIASLASNGTGNLPDFLAQASLHRFDGEASRVSYVAQLNTVGGLSPAGEGRCRDAENGTVDVAFRANYTFWRQDTTPPAVPASLSVSTQDHPVEAFFAEGFVTYVAGRLGWTEANAAGKLYDMPGGVEVGAFGLMRSKANNLTNCCLSTNDPTNGFTVCARQLANVEPVVVTPGSLPWSLMTITNSTGNTAILGPFTSLQMVSTLGGLAPPSPPTTHLGTRQHSSFSAIFWLYTNQ